VRLAGGLAAGRVVEPPGEVIDHAMPAVRRTRVLVTVVGERLPVAQRALDHEDRCRPLMTESAVRGCGLIVIGRHSASTFAARVLTANGCD
jgi:hypothetical protein